MNEQQYEFLRDTLDTLNRLEEAAAARYHGVLSQLLMSARQETEMLLREEEQIQSWPRSEDHAHVAAR